MTLEFDRQSYNNWINQLKSYSSLVYCEPELYAEGVTIRKQVVDELKKKYPEASDGALHFLVSYELDELTKDPLYPEYEKEALNLIAS